MHMVEPALSGVYHDEPLAVGFLREAGIIRNPAALFEVHPLDVLCRFGRSRVGRNDFRASMIPLVLELSSGFMGTDFAICGCVTNSGIVALCPARRDWMTVSWGGVEHEIQHGRVR